MSENDKQDKPVRRKIYKDTRDEVLQPEGKFEDPFKARRDAQAQAEREARAARPRQQDQTPE